MTQIEQVVMNLASGAEGAVTLPARRPVLRWARTGALLLATSACTVGHDATDNGAIVNVWEPVPAALQSTVSKLNEEQLFEDAVDMLNARFRLPEDLLVVHRECGEPNSFYNAPDKRILLCYEMLSSIEQVVRGEPLLTEDELLDRIRSAWMFVFFHELGHALIAYYDIPVIGHEEDAVDNFATLLLIHANSASYAIFAAAYWSASDTGMENEVTYADEHALNRHRFYSILCMVYGSEPAAYQSLVSDGTFTEERASRCPGQYQQIASSWTELLRPWAKPL